MASTSKRIVLKMRVRFLGIGVEAPERGERKLGQLVLLLGGS